MLGLSNVGLLADSQENTTRNLESMEQRQQLSVAQVSVAEVQVAVAKSTKNHRLRDGVSAGAGVQIVLHSNDIRRLCFLWQKKHLGTPLRLGKLKCLQQLYMSQTSLSHCAGTRRMLRFSSYSHLFMYTVHSSKFEYAARYKKTHTQHKKKM